MGGPVRPAELPLHFVRTDDAQVHLMFRTATGPFNVDDYTLVAELRERADVSLTPLKTFTVTRGALVGEVTLSLEEEDTADLPPRTYWSFRTYLPATDFWQTWLAGNVRTDYTAGEADFNDYTVSVGADEVQVVLAANVGPAGPPGADGAPGQQGTTGASAYDIAVANGFVGTEQEWLNSLGSSTYVHDQSSASSVWTINHGLGIFPSVTTVTSAGDVVVGNVHYSNTSTVTVTFSAALGGFAYLS